MKHVSPDISIADVLGSPLEKPDALALLQQDKETYLRFLEFPSEEQEQILTFLEGSRGLPILYDNFFKKIMNPDLHPERLESFLSAILNQTIRIHSILPREGNKLTDSGSLVIMDILVELTDKSIINVEMQKIGYAFPGERSSCYISDLIMRQYNRVRSESQKNFSFKDLKPVYLIVLMEKSSSEFLNVSPHYIHRSNTIFDSGAPVHILGNIVYISLDTFHFVVQNINTELEAWLTFLSSDQPSDILKLVNKFPKFKSYYADIAAFRQHPKELIYMFSEALTIMDRNTVKYMCEEQKKEIASLTAKLAKKDSDLAKKDSIIESLQAELNKLKHN